MLDPVLNSLHAGGHVCGPCTCIQELPVMREATYVAGPSYSGSKAEEVRQHHVIRSSRLAHMQRLCKINAKVGKLPSCRSL